MKGRGFAHNLEIPQDLSPIDTSKSPEAKPTKRAQQSARARPCACDCPCMRSARACARAHDLYWLDASLSDMMGVGGSMTSLRGAPVMGLYWPSWRF